MGHRLLEQLMKAILMGLSFTYSSNPRQHIWTFAGCRGERYNTPYNCPCSIHGGFDPPSYACW